MLSRWPWSVGEFGIDGALDALEILEAQDEDAAEMSEMPDEKDIFVVAGACDVLRYGVGAEFVGLVWQIFLVDLYYDVAQAHALGVAQFV